MSLTSYRAAPPRVACATFWSPYLRIVFDVVFARPFGRCICAVSLMSCVLCLGWFGGPGGDRLSRTLGCSIMGAGGFHVRVRDGIGCSPAAMATRLSEPTLRDVFVSAFRATSSLSRGSGSGVGATASLALCASASMSHGECVLLGCCVTGLIVCG